MKFGPSDMGYCFKCGSMEGPWGWLCEDCEGEMKNANDQVNHEDASKGSGPIQKNENEGNG